MAGNPLLSGTPAIPLVGVVQNPTQTQNPDVTVSPMSMGRNGDVHATPVHGSFYAATARGRVFSASAAAKTGTTLLAPGGTTSGFMFYNPVGSGINMEILEIAVMPTTATDVVGSIGLEFGAPPSVVGNADVVNSDLIGGSSQTALGKASHGSTIVAMTFLRFLPIFVQTTAGVLQGSLVVWEPNGSLILAPGGAVNIVAAITSQGANVWSQGVTWAEWPL